MTEDSGAPFRSGFVALVGRPSVGKSTLASQFPSPLFLDIEGGTAQMDVRRIEKPAAWSDLLAVVNEVAQNP